MLCVLGWLNLSVCLSFVLCVIVHELGHYVSLRLCSVSVVRTKIGLHGAVMETAGMSEWQELICAAAGPVASAILGLVLLRKRTAAALISFGLAAVNLLPLYPLDGGRILRSILFLCCGAERAERIVHWTTIAVCLVLMLLACWGTIVLQAGVWPIFAALVLLWRAGDAEKQLLF